MITREYIKSLFENKYASLLILMISFFIMLSVKLVPHIYYTLENNIDFKTFELFPLDVFDYFILIFMFFMLKTIINSLANIYFKINNPTNISKTISRKFFFRLTLIFIVAWLPYFFAFYPGTLFYDEMFAMRDPFNTFNQPYIYGLLLKFFWDLGKFAGDETFGFAVFIIIKIIVMSASFSYLICFLYKRNISFKFLVFAIIIFALLPIFPNNVITVQKDGLSALFIMLMTLFLYEYKNKISQIFIDKKTLAEFCLLSSLIILIRSNGIYPMLFLALYFLFTEKAARLRIIFYIAFILAVSILPNINRLTPFEEAAGVPIQQVGRTLFNNGVIMEDDRKVFQNVLDLEKWKNTYNTLSVDYTKWSAGFNSGYLNSNKGEFMKSWAKTYLLNPSIYFTAHAFNTYDFWSIAPYIVGSQTIYTGAITKEQLNVKNIIADTKTYLVSDKILKKRTSEKIANFMQKHTVYLNAGSCAFIMIFMMAFTLQIGKNNRIIPMLPAFLSWLTILIASPVAYVFRYTLYLAFLMPFILSLPFMSEEENI